MSKTRFGVDLSEHNGTVNFKKLAQKADFVILRLGWAGNGKQKTDALFEDNYRKAKAAGLKLGVYIYMYTKTPAAAEAGAAWALRQLEGKVLDLPAYCDMEDHSIAALGKTKLTEIAEAFMKTLERGGCRAGIYANLDWYRNKLLPAVRNYPTWIAHYTSGRNKYRGSYGMWQNSSQGKISGVKGYVDTDYLYEDFGSDEKKSVDTLAHEVLDGKWGNGSERKRRLKEAGYDYAAVQKRVNELLKKQ